MRAAVTVTGRRRRRRRDSTSSAGARRWSGVDVVVVSVVVVSAVERAGAVEVDAGGAVATEAWRWPGRVVATTTPAPVRRTATVTAPTTSQARRRLSSGFLMPTSYTPAGPIRVWPLEAPFDVEIRAGMRRAIAFDQDSRR